MEEEQNQEQKQENNSSDETSRLKIDKDYISKLPYEILAQILSIYPLDSGSKAVAIYTGIWNKPFIQHKGTTVKIQDFESVLSNFLVNFDENYPFKSPRKLEFHFNGGSIITVSIGLNKKLDLDFSKGNQESPRKFEWEIVINTFDFPQPSSYPFSAKTLKLTSVDYLSCELVSSLIRKFLYVKTLIIDKCDQLSTLIIVNCDGLKTLIIDKCDRLSTLIIKKCDGLKTLIIDKQDRFRSLIIGKCDGLKTLISDKCDRLSTLIIKKCDGLKTLIIDKGDRFRSLIIGKCDGLKTLIIDKCDGFTILRAEQLAKLTKLIIRDCGHLKLVFIDNLELKSLRYVGPVCCLSFNNVKYLT